MDSYIFPCFNGNFCTVNKNGVISVVKKSGAIFVQSFRLKQSPIPNKKIPFLRGLEYLIFGTYYFFLGLMLSFKSEKMVAPMEKMSKSLNVEKKYIFGAMVLLAGFCISYTLLGIVPTHVGYYIAGANFSYFVKKLFIALTKVIMFYALLGLLLAFPSMRKFYKFNAAGNKALNGQTKLAHHKATNYLNVVIFSCVLYYFVISLLGLVLPVYVKPIVNLLIFAAIFSISYEICHIFDKYLKNYSHITLATSFFVTSKPAGTELQVANTALSEGLLMQENERRETIKEDSEGAGVAFSLCYAEVREKLKQAGIEDRAEADWLIATVLGKNRAEIKLLTQISRVDYKRILSVLERRVKGEPIEKIFGKTEFYGLPFGVTEDVLSPRKETEVLVEEVLKSIGKDKKEVLDLCTGSGAIAVAIAKNSNAKVQAADISSEALEVAKKNALLNGVKIAFHNGDMFSALKKQKKFDIITCNPPYIKTEDIKTLDREVREHDPILALDGGEDGLQFYRKLAREAGAYLVPQGKIFIEIGKGQAQSVKKLFSKNGFSVIVVKDYSGIQRIIIGEKNQDVRENKKDKRKI